MDEHHHAVRVDFNRTDCRLLIICTHTGFVIYSTSPCKQILRQLFDDDLGSVVCAEMKFRSNIIAMVREQDLRKITLWDADKSTLVKDFEATTRSPIVSLKYHHKHLIAICTDGIEVHDFNENVIKEKSTPNNPSGICAMCTDRRYSIMAYPGLEKGSVIVVNLFEDSNVKINAHDYDIAFIALNHCGSLLATASGNGRLIKVFDASTGTKMYELRRGSTDAVITSICFSRDDSRLCCFSENGTLHVWNLGEQRKSLVDAIVNYKSSDWKHNGIEGKAQCSFSPEDSSVVYVVSSLYKLTVLELGQAGMVRVVDTHDLIANLNSSSKLNK
ncbi:WD repeat domain phosphoinositide-interacting protein WDR45 [Acrasis kona]|uniref:WD repeat domain phosphoinositide-interacting protein WDR45 n=1 Tax=Acrasis kona TaxID=1008807 RepID=A0AAW2ZIY4_9EUKA